MELVRTQPTTPSARVATTTILPETWSWGPTSPFYNGDDWQDYLSNGSLIREMITSGFGSNLSAIQNFLLDQPSNGLLVYGASSALAQIPNSYFLASNRDLPTGWYTKDSTLRIVVPNYDNQTLSRYSFVLRSQADILSDRFDPRIVDAGNAFVEYLEGLIPLGLLNFINFDELGAWQLVATETTPLVPIDPNQKSVLDGMDLTVKKPNTDFLGLLVSGVGIFTGNPLLIGGGLVLSFIQGRQDSFEVHTMRNPATGERFTAYTQADHERYATLGYTHD